MLNFEVIMRKSILSKVQVCWNGRVNTRGVIYLRGY